MFDCKVQSGEFPVFLVARSGSVGAEQPTAGDEKVGQGEETLELGGVLGQASIAGLAVPEEVLEDVKGMLHPRPHLGFELLKLLGEFFDRPFGHGFDSATLGGHVPFHAWALAEDLLALFDAQITRVGKGGLLLAMQQGMSLRDVRHVRRRAAHAVHQPRLRIHADVSLHAEMPLVALLGLVHLRVAFLARVLGRGRRRDDRRIHDGAFSHEQLAFAQKRTHFGKDRLRKMVRLQQMAELQERRRIGHRFHSQINAGKCPHGLAVIEGIFERFIGQRIPLLEKVNAQHPLDAHRRPPTLPLGIVRCDHPTKPLPRHHLLHLPKKPLPPRHLLLPGILTLRETHLLLHTRKLTKTSPR